MSWLEQVLVQGRSMEAESWSTFPNWKITRDPVHDGQSLVQLVSTGFASCYLDVTLPRRGSN